MLSPKIELSPESGLSPLMTPSSFCPCAVLHDKAGVQISPKSTAAGSGVRSQHNKMND
jgi:hypothetical protein